MKKIALIGALVVALSAGVAFAQMGNGRMMNGDEQGYMMNRNMMNMPMMYGRHMMGMMGNNIVATSDGGVVVMSFNKLYKFDKNLKLVKETNIPFDKEHVQKMIETMRDMGMMWGNQGSGTTGSQGSQGSQK